MVFYLCKFFIQREQNTNLKTIHLVKPGPAMYTDPGNSIYTKTEDKLGLENHRIFLLQQSVQVPRCVKVKINTYHRHRLGKSCQFLKDASGKLTRELMPISLRQALQNPFPFTLFFQPRFQLFVLKPFGIEFGCPTVVCFRRRHFGHY